MGHNLSRFEMAGNVLCYLTARHFVGQMAEP